MTIEQNKDININLINSMDINPNDLLEKEDSPEQKFREFFWEEKNWQEKKVDQKEINQEMINTAKDLIKKQQLLANRYESRLSELNYYTYKQTNNRFNINWTTREKYINQTFPPELEKINKNWKVFIEEVIEFIWSIQALYSIDTNYWISDQNIQETFISPNVLRHLPLTKENNLLNIEITENFDPKQKTVTENLPINISYDPSGILQKAWIDRKTLANKSDIEKSQRCRWVIINIWSKETIVKYILIDKNFEPWEKLEMNADPKQITHWQQKNYPRKK